MPRLSRYSIPFAMVAGFGGLVALTFAESNHYVIEPPATTQIPVTQFDYHIPPATFSGATSCASASCHGGGSPGKVGSEYSTWIDHDPHSRAYRVLFNEDSTRIARKMKLRTPAHQDTLCLKCHSLNIEHPEPQTFQAGGASCENCHGGSGNWLTEHYQPSFKALTIPQKAERGLYPTKDLAFRTTLCASCHVGTEHQEVNHDLIAAGHPRLMFEYTSYQHHPKYTPHWTEKNYGSDFEARAWTIGQVAIARASVDLLRARAERAVSSKVVWPELTEYSCYACHQNIGPNRESWRPLNKTDRKPGALAWGTWTMPPLPVLAHTNDEKRHIAEVVKLREMMEGTSASNSQVAEQSRKALKELGIWLAHLERDAERSSKTEPMSNRDIKALLHIVSDNALSADGTRFNNLDWDGAAQHYLGLASLYSIMKQSQRDPELETALSALKQALKFPPEYNSPRAGKPAEILLRFQQIRSRAHEFEFHP